MPPSERLGVVVLAAGASRRFGAADKLLAPVGGRPMAAHAFARAAAVAAAARVAVVSAPGVADLARGAGLVPSPVPPGHPQSHSLRAGLDALPQDVEAALILLADMPFVTDADIAAVLARGAPACAADGPRRMPPALLPRAWWSDPGLTGDAGARALLMRIPPASCIALPPAHLRDIDRPADLAPPA